MNWANLLWLLVFYCLILPLPSLAQISPETKRAEKEHDFCDALARAVPGAEIKVQVTGAIVLGGETQFFYDPDEPECRLDLQPVSTVDFLSGTDVPEVRDLLKKYGQAMVDVEGTLYGPLSLRPDEPRLPLIGAYINRTNYRRYGHMDIFRTRLLVRHINHAERVKPDIRPPVIFRSEAPTLKLLELAIPVYPEAARHAGIESDVVMRLEVTGGRATSIHLVDGDRIFERAIIDAIEHWRFDSRVKGTLDSIFSFRLEQRLLGASQDPRVEATPPHFVRITAPGDFW